MADFKVPLIIRGRIIEENEIEFKDRGAGRSFLTPDVGKYVDQLTNKHPGSLMDLYEITLDDIYQYLEKLGEHLDLDSNEHWRQAFEVSCHASNLSRPVLEHLYRTARHAFSRQHVESLVENRIGSEFLEGWVPSKLFDGRTIHIRALGSRSVHIIAGNVPFCAVITVIRSAITRNDAIIKAPSNDPLTISALLRTMIDMEPDHPITRHFSAAYWKGGDEKIETKIYQADNIEKIVAWGGFASIKHISKYLGPGIDLITLDPKSSTTLIGKEALSDEDTMKEVAARVAADMGGWDQEACVNARVMYLESGTDSKGISLANQFGQMIFDALQALPLTTSGGPVNFSQDLKAEIQSISPLKEFYKVITEPGMIEKKGGVIVSQMSEPVDFPKLLYGRVGNLVPLDDIEEALSFFTTATQTVGIYPRSLRERLRDKAALMGGQIFQPVGYAIQGSTIAPQDGIEPERRMCRWVVDNDCEDSQVPAPWKESP
jgi:Acyl-CoA reductase (LuxC)